jgi:hypothetical protein
MSDSHRLADQMTRALDGNAWHGPSWREILEGMSPQQAAARPLSHAHTVVELVLHATAWNDVVRRRLGGESPTVSDSEDWPAPPAPDAESWARIRRAFFETGHALAESVRAFPPEDLHRARPGVGGTWFDLIAGQLQHLLYHAGQVALLKKSTPA